MNWESHILEHAIAGNAQALEQLLETHMQSIYGACYRVCLDSHHAQDITQNVVIKIIKNIGKFSQKSSFQTWYYRIAYNESINFLKKYKKSSGDLDEILEHTLIVNDEVWQAVDTTLLKKELTDTINTLPLVERNIILYFYYDDLKIREIAEIMELNENTIKTKLSRSKKYLSTHLSHYESND
jgi:RNA polymerase sigma-70 factor, ECF subfamily